MRLIRVKMKERFKKYLEEQFRQIAPTKAAMEYRIDMLTKMMDRAQELKIKGMTDDELIYNTVVGELGDFAATLRGYENKVVKNELNRRVTTLGAMLAAAFIVALVICYLIVGFVTKIWHPTWLIIVGGTLLGIDALMIFFAARLAKKKFYLPLRALLAGIISVTGVVLFLFLQLVGNITGSYFVFLAMVAVILGVDTLISFISGSKLKWIELPVFVEVLSVMLYVMLGISLMWSGKNIWHPTWIICLSGVVVALAEGIVILARRASEKKKEATEENTVVNEEYWTKWE